MDFVTSGRRDSQKGSFFPFYHGMPEMGSKFVIEGPGGKRA